MVIVWTAIEEAFVVIDDLTFEHAAEIKRRREIQKKIKKKVSTKSLKDGPIDAIDLADLADFYVQLNARVKKKNNMFF